MVDEDQSDPLALRITAAHLLLDLLDPTDRVGLVLFPPDGVQPTMGSVGESRSALHDRLNNFHSLGATDLLTAFQSGLKLLDKSEPGRTKAILLLTDGLPTADQKAALLDLAKEAKAKHQAALYLIALRPKSAQNQSGKQLLVDMAKSAESQNVWQVAEAADLGQAFLEILQNLKGLNIEAAQAGSVTTSGLNSEVRIAGILRQGERPAINLAAGRIGQIAQPPDLPANVTYSPFVAQVQGVEGDPELIRVGATVSWKVERPPVALLMESPALLATLPSNQEAEVPIRLRLSPCTGSLPRGLTAVVEVLNAERRPAGFSVTLQQEQADPARMSGSLHVRLTPGDYVLRTRILARSGQQVALLDQSVKAPSDSQWLVEAPAALVSGESATATVTHLVKGMPADVLPQPLTLLLPNGEQVVLPLTPAGAPGRFTAPFTTPLDAEGSLRYQIGDQLADLTTILTPVRLQITAPATVEVPFRSWWGKESITVRIDGRTTILIEQPERLPPLLVTASPLFALTDPWERVSATTYETTARFGGAEGESFLARIWAAVHQRSVTVRLAPIPGDEYYQGDPLDFTITLKLRPLIHWPYLLGGLLALFLLYRVLKRLLARGPQQRVVLTFADGGDEIDLSRKRWRRSKEKEVRWQIRLGHPERAPDVALPGTLPAGMQLSIYELSPYAEIALQVESDHPLLLNGSSRQGLVRLNTGGTRYRISVAEYRFTIELLEP